VNGTPQARSWGAWATLALGLGVAAAFVVVQIVVVGAIAARQAARGVDPDALAAELGSNGAVLALATCATTLVCGALLWWLARLRGSPAVYLGLTPVSRGTLVRWLATTAALGALWDLLTKILGRPVIPEFMLEAYATAVSLPLFWFAIVVAAPLFEELFFRGFLYRGLRASRLGASGSIAVTAALWALIHVQYDVYEVGSIFGFGLVLGIARERTGSTATAIAMHSLLNLIAMVQVAATI
jgi:membrane protease YdiL (CAAX protease family)